jgi:hypothetical protein
MVIGRITASIRKADYGALFVEAVFLVIGILLALAVDRWNQDRLDAIETARIVARLKSDTARNLSMFERELPAMESGLRDIKTLYRALQAGKIESGDVAQIEAAMTRIDVVPSYPLVFSAYQELVATGRLRELDDPALVDLLANQRAQYEAAQAVVGYWRDLIQGPQNALDRHVDYFYTTEQMNEAGMGVRYDFAALAADRSLKNQIFEAVDVHGDWLALQTDIYETTKQIGERLHLKKE